MSRRRLSFAFAGALLFGLLVSAIAFVSLVNRVGRGYCPCAFVPLYHQYKLERLRHASSPKIVFLGGSMAQECILPDVVSRELGMDVVLAGTFVHIPMRFYPAMIEDVIHEGDILYLLLEQPHYESGSVLSTTGVSMLLGVDPRMRSTLYPGELFDLYARKGLGWLQCTVPKRIPSRTYAVYDPNALYRFVQEMPGHARVDGLGTYGEDRRNFASTCGPEQTSPFPDVFSREFHQSMDRILSVARSRGARVVVGIPLCPHYPDDPSLTGFARSLGKMGLPVIGTPLESCLPYGLLSDTVMHCNKAGKRYFTHQVVCGLKRFLRRGQMPDEPWPLCLFSADRPDSLSLALPETCRARETFAEFIVDRGSRGCTNVLKGVLVNGRSVPFVERIRPVKNVVWAHWTDETGRADVRLVFRNPLGRCRGERVFVEPYRLDELQRMTAFNEIVGFRRSADNSRRYEATASAGRLTFRVPKWASNRYRCRLRLRIDPRIGAFVCGGFESTRWITDRSGEKDGILQIQIVPNESSGFVDEKGDGVFGLRFDRLPSGASVELVSCEFDML